MREDNEALNKTTIISYDVSGNITQVKEAAYTTGTPTVFTQTINYGYDLQNKDRLITVGNETISSYDAMGNPWVYRGNPFAWTRGRLITQCKNAAFFYDADGVRKEKVVGTIVTKYYTEGNRIHKEVYGSNTLWYYYDQTGVTAMDYNGARYFFQKNLQGDIIRILNSSGAVVASYVYDAWGNHKVYDASGVENTSATFIGNINPFRYRGYYYDTETGLYYLNSRYYDSQVRRFINADDYRILSKTSDILNGQNLYIYCNNNPVMYKDPSGHFAFWIFFAIVGISVVGGALDGGITAAMSGQNFWKGFAAGAIGGFVGGVISYFIPGFGSILARGASSFTYDILNELFQTGTVDANNIPGYIFDVTMDMAFSMWYIGYIDNIASKLLSTAINAVADSVVDILQTVFYFSPQAQQNIKKHNIFVNKEEIFEIYSI